MTYVLGWMIFLSLAFATLLIGQVVLEMFGLIPPIGGCR